MKKIISCLLIIAIFLSLFTMVTFAEVLPPNVVANYHFTTSTHGWSVFGTSSSIIYQNGYVGTNTYGKSWISPAKNIYDVIKTEGAGTYVINARIYIDYDSVDKVQAKMMMRGDRAYSFFPDHYGENRGGIGVLTYFEPRTWTNISGSIKVLESDIDYDTGEFTLCFDCFDDSAPYNVYIDNVTICKLYEDDITNGDFSWNEIGWRNWGGDGNFTIEYRYENQLMNYVFQAYYLKASTYGSIVTNVDQIIAKYGCTKYKLKFKIKVEEDYLENLDKIRFFLARDNGDYNYWIGAANATALEDGKWLTVEKTIDMATMITNEQTLYDKLAPYRNEVFLRFDYVDAAGSTYDEEHSYYITDVSFMPVIMAEKIVFQKTSMIVETGWDGNNPAIVYPTNTTNKALYWTSSDSTVATVERNTGFIVARGAGTAVITAHLVNGTQKASFTIKVKDSVLIRRDSDGFCEVVLSSGKIWKCIDDDVVFYDQYGTNPAGDVEHQRRMSRCAYNYYEVYNSPNEKYGQKEYTDAELKLLYIIDPYGVAKYVNLKASNGFSNVNDGLEYKDRVFRMLFNRDPIFHKKNQNNNWMIIDKNNIDSRDDAFSEAEALFGYHVIDGENAILVISSLLIDIVSIALAVACPAAIPAFTMFEMFAETLFYQYAFSQAVVKNDVENFLLEDTINNKLEEYFESKDLLWAYNLVTDFIDLNDVYNNANDIPQYDKRIYERCNNIENYVVKIELCDGTQHKISEVLDILQ